MHITCYFQKALLERLNWLSCVWKGSIKRHLPCWGSHNLVWSSLSEHCLTVVLSKGQAGNALNKSVHLLEAFHTIVSLLLICDKTLDYNQMWYTVELIGQSLIQTINCKECVKVAGSCVVCPKVLAPYSFMEASEVFQLNMYSSYQTSVFSKFMQVHNNIHMTTYLSTWIQIWITMMSFNYRELYEVVRHVQ